MPDRFHTRDVPQVNFYELWGDDLYCPEGSDTSDGTETVIPNSTNMGVWIGSHTSGAIPYPTDTKEDFKREYFAQLAQLDVLGVKYDVREGIVSYWS